MTRIIQSTRFLCFFLWSTTLFADIKQVGNDAEFRQIIQKNRYIIVLIKNQNQTILTKSFASIAKNKLLKRYSGIFASYMPTAQQIVLLRKKYQVTQLPAILFFENGKLKTSKNEPAIIYSIYSRKQLVAILNSLINENRERSTACAPDQFHENLPKHWVHTPASLYFSGGYEGPFWDDYNPYWYSPYAFYPWAYSYPYEYGYPVRGSFGINFSF